MSTPSRGTIKALANLLLARSGRPEESPFVLVLGAGASIRSGCPPMMEVVEQIIKKYGDDKTLSRSGEDQIEEFFSIMDGLGDLDLWLELDQLFTGARPSVGYERLAQLVKDGYFRVILSTNVDTLMEKALEGVGLSLISDVDVIDCGGIKTDADAEPVVGRLKNPTPRVKLVKLHGYLPTRQLKFRVKDVFEFPEKLAKAVTEYVSNHLGNVIIVGHSLRDVDLNACFQARGGAIWYVNPQYPTTNDFSGKVVANRSGSHYIDSKDGDFDRFFDELLKQVRGPADGIPRSVDFLNRLNELRDIKTRLSLPRYPPVTIISGPMGYGKTCLLREVAHDLEKEKGWNYALLECEKFAGQNAKVVMSALASAFGCQEVADWEHIGACLGQRITDQTPQYRAILLVDGIDYLSVPVRRELLVGLNTIYECVKEARGECRIVLSGRYIGDDLDGLEKEISDKGALPFGRPGIWCSKIPLSEFGQDVIVDLIRRVAKREFEIWEYDVMSRSLLEITGGHPKGLVDIVTKDLDKIGWTFGKKPGMGRFYFTPETNDRLFTTYMVDVINEIKLKIGEQWWEDFQSVCVLRRFNASILEHLITMRAIRQFSRGEDLVGWLTNHFLVGKRPPDMWGDAIARGVVVAEMKMVAVNRKKYGELNRMAADSFSRSFDRLCDVYENAQAQPELETFIIAYGSELIYHRLEATKYSSPSQKLEAALTNVSVEVSGRLMPLGNGIVRKFVEEINEDSEICPSTEAKDTIARSFSEQLHRGGGR
jgi:hypothetical protein